MAASRKSRATTSVPLVYVGPFDEVEVDLGELVHVVARGDRLDVAAHLAGRAPSGEPGEDGFDPGEGLLAQPTNWLPAAETTKEQA
jgi:hypothetical protein